MKKQDLSVKNVVAIGIGSAIYVILARFTSIPTPIPNTNIELVFPFLALFAAIYGAKVGFAVGFIGHTLSDFIMYGQTWWSWVLATGVLGLIIGLACKKLDLKNGIFGIKQILLFNITQIIANIIAWIIVAPIGDIIIYSEPVNKVFVQGISATLSNGITILIVGTLLLKAYAGTKIKKGSLRKEDQKDLGMTEPIITFKNFSFKYDSQAFPTLQDINLTINRGEKILIAGPSGSGKSTIGHCINGLIPNIDTGTITGECLINGKNIKETDLFDLSFTTSTILQDTDSQFIGLTVGEDIAFALENDCRPQNKIRQTVHRWADKLEINDLLKQAPQSLSGGQKQTVALAGVLIDESPIMLFDEPLANLDPASGMKTMALIDQIQKELNATVIIIEHRLEEVLSQPIDHVVLVNDGKIIADKSPNDLLHQNKLEDIGVRSPLYLTALTKAGVDLDAIPDLTSIKALPDDEKFGQKLQKWADDASLTSKKEEKQPLLELKGVGHRYNHLQVNPLRDVTATITKGDFVSIVGQNGAGKTTLCRLICGFIPNEGKILFDDDDLSQYSIKQISEKIGYVMQDPNQMISQKMIFDEVALGLCLRGYSKDEIKDKVFKTLKICGLYPYRHWPISALSFGQKKRVTIAAILVLEPDIIILDEPTAGQDWKTYTEIMSFLKKLNEQGKTIMIITHDMYLMMEYTNRSLAFADGKLIADTEPIRLLTEKSLIKKASLKRTSLYDLAHKYNLRDPNYFVRAYVDSERTSQNA